MTDDLFRGVADFTVSRRVPWETDDALRPHIDRVVDALRTADAAAVIEVDADLETTRVLLSLTVVGHSEEDHEALAREAIATAIRECGGRHEGLLRLADESRLSKRSGPWSGLRTPNWALFTLRDEPVAD